jgi:hypothetical protein
VGEVSELLEETINRVRQGPFDLRAANAIGYLAYQTVEASMKGQPSTIIDRAVIQARQQADFLFQLVVHANSLWRS